MAKTADRLLEGVKRRCVIPANQALLSDTDILAVADDIIASRMVPMMLSIRQDFFVITVLGDVVDGTSEYDIPYRSIGRTLRDLKLYDGSSYRDLSLLALEDEQYYLLGGIPYAFYFKGDKVVLVPEPNTGSLQLQYWYDLAPSSLVTLDQAAVVVSSTTTTVTISAAISGIVTGSSVDFIQAKSGNSMLAMDKTIQNASGTTYTFTSGDIPTSLVAGDYISIAQTSPVIMLPNECYPLLETLTAKRVLNLLGDFEGAGRLEKDESDEMKMVESLLAPRIQGENTIIINRRGLLRGYRMRFARRMVV